MKNLILILITFIMLVFVSCDTSTNPVNLDDKFSSSSSSNDEFDEFDEFDMGINVPGRPIESDTILYTYGINKNFTLTNNPIDTIDKIQFITLNVNNINSHMIEKNDTLAFIIENLDSLNSAMKCELIIIINYNVDDTTLSVTLPPKRISVGNNIIDEKTKLYNIPVNSLSHDTITNLTSMSVVFNNYDRKVELKLKKILLFQETPIYNQYGGK